MGVGIEEAISWLESHVNLETLDEGRYRIPTLDRISELCDLMANPQCAYPAIHITGTNGKGSVARMVSDLLTSAGLSVGTYTSPDLESLNERLSFRGMKIQSDELA
ncbi:MAG TPA: bifunctional folylpolyglutamate synthase/dihydrofolate synthase, partial [Acidimicrobiales bacterium]|nr:bifunctional folylpolyglutamate synthase/dihydrofolate synthase [Acidimicrobiales bacterium]